MSLKKAHKDQIKALARLSGMVELYTEESSSGASLTLRYHHRWVDQRGYERQESHMIFSILIHEFVNLRTGTRRDDPADIDRFNQMVSEAHELFNVERIKK